MQHFNRTIFDDDNGNNINLNTSGAITFNTKCWTTEKIVGNYLYLSCIQISLMHLFQFSIQRNFLTKLTQQSFHLLFIILLIFVVIYQSNR